MTVEELSDLKAIAAAVARIETRVGNIEVRTARIESKQENADTRMDRMERFADRAEGAITFGKWLASFIGVGGLAALFYALANHGG